MSFSTPLATGVRLRSYPDNYGGDSEVIFELFGLEPRNQNSGEKSSRNVSRTLCEAVEENAALAEAEINVDGADSGRGKGKGRPDG